MLKANKKLLLLINFCLSSVGMIAVVAMDAKVPW